jgi:internalin A
MTAWDSAEHERTHGMYRLLIIPFTLLGVSLARADEASVVAALQMKQGFKMTRAEKQPGKPVIEVSLTGDKFTDEDLNHLREFKRLQVLHLSGASKITDAGLKVVGELKKLKQLSLSDTKVTDSGLKELSALTNLQKLDLSYAPLKGPGLKELRGLKGLQSLMLAGDDVTDATLKDLRDFKGLKELLTKETKITDAGRKELKKALPKCNIQGD